ncbi:MAG: ABC transporter ATP-binding protein [Bacteroidales bacterium]|nr:ABC transporter ATP-binding protein [Bacteroidales bacterium]MDD2205369.1 ABC transporter ATP-binding protein [Bacteroidales bacterium]MDD3152474.1 ABC transporter ATP-binding protein [Bacteroidales bacterium]MDD3914770.1 ABC transporter ATP-binding protein [Bacteroidales bacterium]MDD4634197.1 ABC transporter ATP-binding protein [Bacteroidales bacterium]
MIQLQNIHKSYGNLEVLKGVDLEVYPSEIISLVGASGAGKSTLLYIAGTLDRPTAGKVLWNNEDVFKLNDAGLSDFRNKNIGFIFQFHHLLAEFTALENVCIPAYIAGADKKSAEEKAMYLLKLLSLEDRYDHKPSALSGGEQQRVAVARSLINNPEVLLADEPSGNLDSENAAELHKLFFKIREELNIACVIVTHNQEFAKMADRQLQMVDGSIINIKK